MEYLFLDFETRSELDVQTVGSHKYNMHPSTEILLVSWALGNNPVRVDTEITEELRSLIEREDVIKIAHNAEFDMAVCKYVAGIDIDVWEWFDTAYQAAYYGHPRKLAYLARTLHTTGKGAPTEMLLFSQPVKVARAAEHDDLFASFNPTRYNEPADYPFEWKRFLEYSRLDTEVMRECFFKMAALPDIEVTTMRMTFEMNFNGVPFDIDFAKRIKQKADEYSTRAGVIAQERYGIKNLRSVKQVKEALAREGMFMDSLNKKERMGKDHDILTLRDQASGAAFSKIKTAEERICPDNRLHGEFVGFGAHTGRWSSRGVQLQNFARILSNVSTDLTKVRDYSHLREHLRLSIYAPKPYQFVCADLSQIEARIVSWLAGCKWRMDAFANDEDIYSRSAERMFGLPHVDKSMPERQMGKCAELGLGYGGGGNAIERIAPDFYHEQGAAKIDEIVRRWRSANPEICALWRTLEKGLRTAMVSGVCRVSCGLTTLVFKFDGRTAAITLPSGRALYYRGMTANSETISYLDYSRGGEYPVTTHIWGGVILENVTQAIARDVLVDIMERVKGYEGCRNLVCIGTVHDEVWYLTRDDDALDVLLNEMKRPITWASGLVTKGDGFIHERYIK